MTGGKGINHRGGGGGGGPMALLDAMSDGINFAILNG